MRKILFSLIWILMVPTSVTFAFSDELKEPVVEGLLSEDSPTQKHEMAIYQLFPTQNMWTFILLDQLNGKMWQVQWSMELENRGIILIK